MALFSGVGCAYGFYRTRSPLRLRDWSNEINYADYINLPDGIGVVVSHKYATLKELQTDYSLEDMHDLLEIIQVDNHNSHLSAEKNG